MSKTARNYPEFGYRADESLASWTVENIYAHSAAIGGTRRIDYGDYGADVPLRDIVCRVAELQTLTPFEHTVLLHDVRHELERVAEKITKRTASTKKMEDFAGDLVIWFSNEVIEGRASLDAH